MEAELYCKEKATPAGSNFYYCILFHKPEQKRKLQALFALLHELLDSVYECQDVGVARIKLQWWCDEIDRLFASQSRHPVSKELQELMPELQLDKTSLLGLVNAIEREISPPSCDSMQVLMEQFIHGRGMIWQMAAEACGLEDEHLVAQIKKTGGLSHCLQFIQLAGQQLARGYCPYPQFEMDKYGLSHQNLLQTDNLVALSELQVELYATIHSELTQCMLELNTADRQLVLFALTQTRIAQAICKLMQKQSGDIMAHPASLTPLRKLWIAWRTKMSY